MLGRAIYGAVFGYPGGIAWAIMVARICQLYPMACGATILAKFFNLMHKWNWPRPVMLKDHEVGEFGLRVWNPAVSMFHCDQRPQLIDADLPRRCTASHACHNARIPCHVLDAQHNSLY